MAQIRLTYDTNWYENVFLPGTINTGNSNVVIAMGSIVRMWFRFSNSENYFERVGSEYNGNNNIFALNLGYTPPYYVDISGDFGAFEIGPTSPYITSVHVQSWGNINNLTRAFFGASMLTNITFDAPPNNMLNMNDMFKGCTLLTPAKMLNLNIKTWNVSTVTSMARMFTNVPELYDAVFKSFLIDLSDWNPPIPAAATPVAAADKFLSYNDVVDTTTIDPYSPFYYPISTLNLTFDPSWLGQTVNLPIRDIVEATVDSGAGAAPFTEGSTVTITSTTVTITGNFGTFGNGAATWVGAAGVTGITATSIASIRKFSGAFNGCVQYTGSNGNIIYWDVQFVTDMSYMFNGCTIFNRSNLGNWERVTSPPSTVRNVTKFNHMFKNTPLFNNSDLGQWTLNSNDAAEINMASMFENATSFTGVSIENWVMNRVVDTSNMFNGAVAFNNTLLGSWEVLNIKNTYQIRSMAGMFKGATAFTGVGIHNWTITKVKDFSSMFEGCINFNNQQLGNWERRNPTSTMNEYNETAPNINMHAMFKGATAFTDSSIQSWNTRQVKDMSNMFEGCINFNNQDLSGWIRTSSNEVLHSHLTNVTSMASMFKGATAFQGNSIHLWTLRAIRDVSDMFNGASAFNNAFLGNWERTVADSIELTGHNPSVGFSQNGVPISMARMFQNATAFTGGNIVSWNITEVTDMTGMFNNATALYTAGSSNVNLVAWNPSITVSPYKFFSPNGVQDTTTTDFNSPFVGDVPAGSVLTLTFDHEWLAANNHIVSLPIRGITEVTVNGVPFTEGTDTTLTVDNATVIIEGLFTSFGNGANTWVGAAGLLSVTNSSISSITDLSGAFNGCVQFTDSGIDQWNVQKVTDMSYMFKGASNFNNTSLGSWNQQVNSTGLFTVKNMSYMFDGATSFTGAGIEAWNPRDVTDTSYMFRGATSFNTSLGPWIASGGTLVNVTSMAYMFAGCTNFTDTGAPFLGVDAWTVSAVKDMSHMFDGATSFNNVNLGSWNRSDNGSPISSVSAVTSMAGMFQNATSFTGSGIQNWNLYYIKDVSDMFRGATAFNNELLGSWQQTSPPAGFSQSVTPLNMARMFMDASGFTGGTIGAWGMGQVTDVSDMFNGAVLFNADLNGWGGTTGFGASVTTINMSGMFRTATSFVGIGVNNWIPTKITDMSYMFAEATSFNNTLLDVWSAGEQGDIGANVASVNMAGMFKGATAFQGGTIHGWNPYKVTDMSYMFEGATSFNNTGLSLWGTSPRSTSNVLNMAGMFKGATAFTGNGIENWNPSKVTDMSYMFAGATSFINQGLRLWGISPRSTSNVRNMSHMFNGAIVYTDDTMSGIDIWDVSGVSDMSYMFANAGAFNNYLLGSWNTGSVRNMAGMFNNATTFLGDTIDTWVVSNVTDMSNMFNGASLFNNTTLGFWQRVPAPPNFTFTLSTVENVRNMAGMFKNATAFSGPTIDTWAVSNVTDMSNMFNGASVFNNIFLGFWNTGSVRNMSYMFKSTGLSDVSGTGIDLWNVTNVSDMSYMFANNTGSFTNTGLGNWEREGSTVANVKSMAHMFEYTGFVDIAGTGVDQWNPTGVTDFSYMFANSQGFNNTNLGYWGLNLTEPITMSRMFVDSDFVDVSGTGVDQWIMNQVTDISYMFANTGFANQGLANWERLNSTVANVKNFAGLFSSLGGGGREPSGLNGIDSWVVTGASDMSSMFENNMNLGSPLLGQWETNVSPSSYGTVTSTMSNVNNTTRMFSGCSNFMSEPYTGVDMWNLNSVTDMSYMFAYCSLFNNESLGNWQSPGRNPPTTMGQVRNMSYMFNNSGLIDSTGNGVNQWDVTGVTNMESMFSGAILFSNPNLGSWTTESVRSMKGMFAGAFAFPGTGLESWNVSNVTDFTYMFNMPNGPFNTTPPTMFYPDTGFTNIDLTAWNVSNSTVLPTGFLSTSLGDVTREDPRSPFWDPTMFSPPLTSMTLTFLIDVFSVNSNVALPISGASGDIHVDFGDGRKRLNVFTAIPRESGTGSAEGIVTIWGTFSNFSRYDQNGTGWAGSSRLLTIAGWDSPGITDMNGALMGTTNLTSVPTFLPAGVTNLSYMFFGSAYSGGNIDQWNVSNVTDMSYMFANSSVANNSLGSWSLTNVRSMKSMFYGAGLYTGNSIQSWDVSGVTDMSSLFAEAYSFNNTSLGSWNTSGANTMAGMFSGCTAFTDDTIQSWNVRNVTDMSAMFSRCVAFNNPSLGTWEPVTVATMNSMFDGASGFEGGTISSWYTSTVTDMAFMFQGATSFNASLTPSSELVWNTSAVTDMSNMFQGASSFVGQGLGSWNVSAVQNTSNMFNRAYSFNNDLSSWSLPAVTALDRMFSDTSGLYLAGDFKYDLTAWKGSIVGVPTRSLFFSPDGLRDTTTADIKSPFYLTILPSNFTLYFTPGVSIQPELPISDIGVDGIDVNWYDGNGFQFYGNMNTEIITPSAPVTSGRVDISGSFGKFGNGNSDSWVGANRLIRVEGTTDGSITNLSGAFNNATRFDGTGVDLWDLSAVTDMSYMFIDANIFNNTNLGRWNTSKVENMSGMFYGASSFVDASSTGIHLWDVSVVTDMANMFNGATVFNNTSLNSWDTSKVQNMSGMFISASTFTGYGIENWNTSSVTDMSSMFSGASYLVAELGSWDTSKVKIMSGMFRSASNFSGRGPYSISAWDVSEVTDMSNMFEEASNFDTDLSGWNVSNVRDMSNMFRIGNTDLFTGTGLENWNVSNVMDMAYMFYGTKPYFNPDLSNWNVVKVTDMTGMFQAGSFSGNLVSWASVLNGVIQTPDQFLTDASNGNIDITTTSPRSPFGPAPVIPVQTNSTALVAFTSPPNPSYKLAPGSTIYGTAGTKFYSTNTTGAYTQIMDLSSYGTPVGAMFGNPTFYKTTVFTITETQTGGSLFFYDASSGLSGTIGSFLKTPVPNSAFDASGNLYMLDTSGALYTVTPSMNNQVSTATLPIVAQLGSIGPTSIDVSNNVLYWVQSAGTMGGLNLASVETPTLTLIPGLVQTFLIDSGKVYYYDSTSNLSVYNFTDQTSATLWDFSANPLYGTEPFGDLFIDRTAQTIYGICKRGGPGFGKGFRGGGVLYRYTISSGVMDTVTSYFKDDGVTGSGPLSFTIVPDNGESYVVTGGSAVTPRINPLLVTPRAAGSNFQVSQTTLPGYVTSCFNYGTKILAQVHGAEAWIPVEALREGDIVKTYKHGYRPISHIGKGVLINDAKIWHSSMFQAQMEGFEPLIVTGGHSILVDYLTKEEQEKQAVFWERGEEVIDDKLLMIAPVSPLFTQIKERKLFTYYHFSVQNDGDNDRRYGVWANGFLTETPSVNQYKLHKYHAV